MYKKIFFVLAACTMLCITATSALSEVRLKKGQTVYVPAYSHVLIGPRGHTFNLAVTLAIRNTDPHYPITVIAADYFDTAGKLVKKFIDSPIKLNPMASTHLLIEEADTRGGLGANFIVRWKAEREVNAPIIESVMIGGRSGQGISFISPGQEISE